MASKVESSGLSIISEERASARKHADNDENESVLHHKNRSAYGGHKKKLHPLMLGPSRQNQGKLISLHAASKNNLSEFTQRIMSAKLLRVKQVQNQLNETQIQLNELINENRILRNLQKRQEGALRRYEGNHAELPQLIRSHNEEIRTLKANNKIIKSQLRESTAKLKERENELETLRDSYNKLKKLSTEKNLLEREKLQRKVEELQDVIKEQEEKIQVLSRKVLLESKNYRHHLNVEIMKHKETQKDLTSALSVISKLETQLTAKDRFPPGGKMLLKRDTKTVMPYVANHKPIEIQPKIGGSEESFLNQDDGKKLSRISDSPDSELELLNALGSSEDTPSPTQDIFPIINRSKKSSPEMEITTSKLEMFQLNCDLPGKQCGNLRSKKASFSKRNPRLSSDIETNARVIAEVLQEDMDTIDDLAQKVTLNSSDEKKDRLGSLCAEVTANASKLETEINNQLGNTIKENHTEEEDKAKDMGCRRILSKRKLEEEKLQRLSSKTPDLEVEEQLTQAQQQKLENMTKTWNDIKNKIQEERKKAEEKVKELNKMNGLKDMSSSESSESISEKPEVVMDDIAIKPEIVKDLRFINFTEDEYILQELEKTDKIFNKLKNENRKAFHKTTLTPTSSAERKSKTNVTSKPRPKQQTQDVKSFRTESQREPKFLEDFQSEYQKQNLLKALKAIDVGKDPAASSEESTDSESESKTLYKRNEMKHVKKISPKKGSKDLMSELFGSSHKLDKNENMKLEYGTVAGAND